MARDALFTIGDESSGKRSIWHRKPSWKLFPKNTVSSNLPVLSRSRSSSMRSGRRPIRGPMTSQNVWWKGHLMIWGGPIATSLLDGRSIPNTKRRGNPTSPFISPTTNSRSAVSGSPFPDSVASFWMVANNDQIEASSNVLWELSIWLKSFALSKRGTRHCRRRIARVANKCAVKRSRSWERPSPVRRDTGM